MNELSEKVKNPLIREAILKRNPEFLFFFSKEYRDEKKRRKHSNHIDYCDYSESYFDRQERKKLPLNEREDRTYHTDYIKGDPREDESVYYDMDF